MGEVVEIKAGKIRVAKTKGGKNKKVKE